MHHASIKKVPATLLALLLTILLLAGAATAKQAEEEEESCDPRATVLIQSAVCLPAGWELVEPDEPPKGGSCGGPNEELGPPISHHTCLCDEEGPDGQAKCFSDPVEINLQANLEVIKLLDPSLRTRRVFASLVVRFLDFKASGITGSVEFILSRLNPNGAIEVARQRGGIWLAGQHMGMAGEYLRLDRPLAPGEYQMKASGTVNVDVITRSDTGRPAIRQVTIEIKELFKGFKVRH